MALDKDTIQPCKRPVYIRVVFLKVGEIDTVHEQFNADVFIQARWHEPKLDGKNEDISDISKYWSPKLIVPNLLDAKKNVCRYEVDFQENKETFVFEKHRIKGQFSEKLELKEFPFDKQALNIQISSELPNTEVELVEDTEEISDIEVSCFIDEQEWHLFDFVEIAKQPHSDEDMVQEESSVSRKVTRKGVNKYPRLYARFYAVRRWGYFMLNFIMIMNFISSVSLATFSVSYTLPQNRLQLSITLMLTSVTYKSVANANLPKISYYTHMDVYIIFSMFFVLLVCFWHAVISLFDGDLQRYLDLGAFVAFCSIFFLFHLSYGLYLVAGYMRRYSSLVQEESIYQEKINKIDKEYWNIRQEKKRNRKRVNLKVSPDDSWQA